MNSANPEDGDRDMAMLGKHISSLSEHFDSVQIFCTRLTPDGGTITTSKGSGNWYARYGQIKEWCIKQDETTREEVRNKE